MNTDWDVFRVEHADSYPWRAVHPDVGDEHFFKTKRAALAFVAKQPKQVLPLAMMDVDKLKAEGRYFHAGALAAAHGRDDTYGCHFGMRSTRERAAQDYKQGHASALFDISLGGDIKPTPIGQPTTPFRIYYMKPEFFLDGISGKQTTDLAATHQYVREIMLPGGAMQLKQVWMMMQGAEWAPRVEMYKRLGARHTSMSVGDVVVVNGRAIVVANIGFRELPREVLRNVPELAGEVR